MLILNYDLTLADRLRLICNIAIVPSITSMWREVVVVKSDRLILVCEIELT